MNYKPTRHVNLTPEKKKHYEALTHEIIGGSMHEGNEEYAEGQLDGIPYVLRAEWVQTCCVSLYCPGDSQLRGYVTFTEDGARHTVDFDEVAYTYRRSYVPGASAS